jgi:hypothetical protein
VIWWVVSAYLTRWRVEETIPFGKQSYQMEDIRVLTYERLRNLIVLVMAAMFFTAVVLGTKMKLSILASHVLKAVKRLFGIPDFRYYALSDGRSFADSPITHLPVPIDSSMSSTSGLRHENFWGKSWPLSY